MTRRAPVLFAVLLMLVTVVPLGWALAPAPQEAPAATGSGAGSFAFANGVYAAELSWPDATQSLLAGGRVFEGTISHAGREAAFHQHLKLGDVFLRAMNLVDDRFFVSGETSTSAGGDPVLTLHVRRGPVPDGLDELRGRVTLTFQADSILHDYEFHLPHVVYANSVHSKTTLAWDAPFPSHGSLLPDGTTVADDGAALDPYGDWKVFGTYGVFVQDAPDALVGHARVRQGQDVNFLRDGSFRVSPSGSVVETVFTAFLDAPTLGIPQELLAEDAIIFPAPATTEALADRLAALASTGAVAPWFDPASVDEPTPSGPIPHVLVGIPDSGINPYHEIYYRPNLTVHPCTYIEGFPCRIPALNLSVGVYESWDEAYAADEAVWASMRPQTWYWIPKTAFVAVMCEGSTNLAGMISAEPDLCLIDDSNMHGTGTTSSVLTENPNALLAFKEGNSGTRVFEDGTLPIDIVSYSWGAPVPLALPGLSTRPRDYTPFFVAASGNEGAFPVVADSGKSSQAVINVGAADAATRSEPGYSGWKTADFVSQYCRPTAQTNSIREYRESYCGTSFSAPTFAGALSKVILELRRESGYTGSIADGMVDPILGVSKWDVRDALNMTATYTPTARYPAAGGGVGVLTPTRAYQWGWGYVDATVVDATLACIRDNSVCPQKDDTTRAFMDAMWTFRDVYGGWTAFDAFRCAAGDAASCDRLPAAVQAVLART